MRKNSFASKASALFSIVPAHVQTLQKLEQFKSALDRFLRTIPDTPPTPNYIGVNNNSLLEWARSGTLIQGSGLYNNEVETPEVLA